MTDPMPIVPTDAQWLCLMRLRRGPEERPTGFAAGTPGWDAMLSKLVARGWAELSAPDLDGRVWATVTDLGADVTRRANKPRGRPRDTVTLAGQLPIGALEALLAKNRKK